MFDLNFYTKLRYIRSLRALILEDTFNLLKSYGGYGNSSIDYIKYLEAERKDCIINHYDTIQMYIYLSEYVVYFNEKFIFD